MYPRTATATLVAGIALAVPSCTTTTPEATTSIPEFGTVGVGIDDPGRGPVAPDHTPAVDAEAADAAPPQRRRRRTTSGRRGKRRFSAFGMASLASGDFDIRDDALGPDDSHAHMVRFRGAGTNNRGIGAGFDVKFIVPGDDFYEGTMNVTDLNQSDLYAYFLAHASSGDVRIPVRIGPYISGVGAEFEVTGDETDYSSFGIRVEIEPEVVFVHDAEFEASLFSRLSAGVHTTFIDDESTDEYYSDGHTLGFEAGIRLAFDPIAISASYILHETTIRESEEERGLVIPRLETEFSGVQVSMGVKF